MRNIILIFIFNFFVISKSFALIEIDITRGNLDPLPIAVSPLHVDIKSENYEGIKVKELGDIVSKNSNSFEIKKAIEMIFKVKVNKVNTSILRGKGKTFKGQFGFRKDIKKAIVTLDEGNTIDSSLEIK